MRKMPALFKMSGYRPTAFAQPDAVITYDQAQLIIRDVIRLFPDTAATYHKYIESQPDGSSYGIPKKSVFVHVSPEATTQDINKLKNNMIKIAGEQNVFAFDVRQFNAVLQ